MSDGEIPEVGGSVTFDFDGHLREAELHMEIPGASGGDPAQWTYTPDEGSDGHHPAPDLSFMPHHEPAFDPTDIMHAPVPEGWERDNLGLLHAHIDGGGEHHDDFQLEMPQHAPEHYEPHLDVPELHLDPEFDPDAN